MRLTSKARYAVAAMMDLCRHAGERPVPLAAVAARQYISLSYLEQLFRKLREAGLVVAARGPGGGYRLARAAETISIADIIRAVEEPMQTTACGGGPRGCRPNGSRCDAHALWSALEHHIETFLSAVSLAAAASGAIPESRLSFSEAA